MLWSDKITLRTLVSSGFDSDGYPTVKEWEDKEVYADVQDVTRSEFYSAASAAMEVQYNFTVHIEDYSGQKDIIYNGRNFELVRKYGKGLGQVVLTCRDSSVNNG